jgi:hypothetical protein
MDAMMGAMIRSPSRPELIVPYDPEQRELYEADDPRSVFEAEKWPIELRRGRQRNGRFPEIAVRASFRAIGFDVLISEPRMPDAEGFILAHYAGMREAGHDAYRRMFATSSRSGLKSSTASPIRRRSTHRRRSKGREVEAGETPTFSCSVAQQSDSLSRSRTKTSCT